MGFSSVEHKNNEGLVEAKTGVEGIRSVALEGVVAGFGMAVIGGGEA